MLHGGVPGEGVWVLKHGWVCRAISRKEGQVFVGVQVLLLRGCVFPAWYLPAVPFVRRVLFLKIRHGGVPDVGDPSPNEPEEVLGQYQHRVCVDAGPGRSGV